MRNFTITITGRVSNDATADDIERMAADAAIQAQEPADKDGEDADFETEGVTYAYTVTA